jgi:hypothetical protein
MDLSLFDHFESASGPSSSAGGSKRAAGEAAPVSKKAKFSESGIEERLAGTVIEKVREGLLMFTTSLISRVVNQHTVFCRARRLRFHERYASCTQLF